MTSNWSPTTFYVLGDIVRYVPSGSNYIATTSSLNQIPPASPLVWTILTPGGGGGGDITDVIAGTGLSGGGSSGAVTLDNTGLLSADSANGSGISVTTTSGAVDIGTNFTSSSGTIDFNPLPGVKTRSIDQSASGVSPGTYTLSTVDVDIYGRVTTASSGTAVTSLDGQTGALTTKSGQYYKTAPQNLTSGSTDITFDVAQSWSDATAISWTPGSQNFTVVTKGLYQFEFAATVAANGATWLSTSNKSVSVDITRSPSSEQVILANQALLASGVNYAQIVTGTIALNPGDVINCRVANTFTGGPPSVSVLVSPIDYNTTFTWTLLKPLP